MKIVMATYDNKHWLLSNIRNSFISTDDTGMCEIVMSGENFPKLFYQKALEEKKKLREAAGISSEDLDKEIITQYDPYPEMEDSDDEDLMNESYSRHENFSANRQRSNTAQWLDKKEQAMKKAAKIKVIKWVNPTTQLSIKERMELFPKKTLEENRSNEKKRSLLTNLLEKCTNLPQNQYVEYAKFDGTAQLGLTTKSFKIFMTMLSEKHRNYPIKIVILASAKIHELVGFTCFKYSVEHPEVILESVNKYGLCIADEDGEMDSAFPCLDLYEPCSKFGFAYLGLVELKNRREPQQSTSIYMPEDGGLNSAFQMFLPKPTDSGQSFQYGSRHNTGGSGTSEAVMSAIQAVNEEKKALNREEDKIQSHIIATEAPQYKAYRVQLLHKMRTNTPVQLGISLDKVEVEPVMSGANKFWPRTKYFLHSIDTVAWCQILESKTNKTIFRLVYTRGNSEALAERSYQDSPSLFHPNSTYKHHDFECEHDTAKQIVEKINRILDLRNSPCRREYKTAKEKKLQTRRSFQTPKNMSCA